MDEIKECKQYSGLEDLDDSSKSSLTGVDLLKKLVEAKDETEYALLQLKSQICTGDSCHAGDIVKVYENVPPRTDAEMKLDNESLTKPVPKNIDKKILDLAKKYPDGNLPDNVVNDLSVSDLNLYEKIRWKNEAEENGIEFTNETTSDGFAKMVDIKDEISFLGTKEYKALKKKIYKLLITI